VREEAAAPRASEALERSARMLAKLDQMEADLHDEGSSWPCTARWSSGTARRHRSACQVADEHVQEIHRLAMAQQKKQQERRASAARSLRPA